MTYRIGMEDVWHATGIEEVKTLDPDGPARKIARCVYPVGGGYELEIRHDMESAKLVRNASDELWHEAVRLRAQAAKLEEEDTYQEEIETIKLLRAWSDIAFDAHRYLLKRFARLLRAFGV